MGAGGVSGELRDHSEHVDAILRSFNVANVANGQASSFTSTSHNLSSQTSASNSFNFPDDVFDEMACFSCSSNFSLFRRKVLAQPYQFFAVLGDLFVYLLRMKLSSADGQSVPSISYGRLGVYKLNISPSINRKTCYSVWCN